MPQNFAKEKSAPKDSETLENTSPISTTSSRNSNNPAPDSLKKFAHSSTETSGKNKNTGISVICQHKQDDGSYDERELLSNAQSNYKMKSKLFFNFLNTNLIF